MNAACICLVFEYRRPPNLGTMGKRPPDGQVGGTSWRQPSTPVAVAGSVLALLFAVAAVAADPTAALLALPRTLMLLLLLLVKTLATATLLLWL